MQSVNDHAPQSLMHAMHIVVDQVAQTIAACNAYAAASFSRQCTTYWHDSVMGLCFANRYAGRQIRQAAVLLGRKLTEDTRFVPVSYLDMIYSLYPGSSPCWGILSNPQSKSFCLVLEVWPVILCWTFVIPQFRLVQQATPQLVLRRHDSWLQHANTM